MGIRICTYDEHQLQLPSTAYGRLCASTAPAEHGQESYTFFCLSSDLSVCALLLCCRNPAIHCMASGRVFPRYTLFVFSIVSMTN